jgi:hypothetical protein
VLDGTHDCPEELDKFTKKFIKELKQPENLHQHKTINGFTTTHDHITSWKKMRVHTAATLYTKHSTPPTYTRNYGYQNG